MYGHDNLVKEKMKHMTNFSYTNHLLKNKPAIIYIKILSSNQGGEYKFKKKNKYCQKEGIKREFIIIYTHQQNGVSEKKNNTSIKVILIMLTSTKLLKFIWGEVLMIANYL